MFWLNVTLHAMTASLCGVMLKRNRKSYLAPGANAMYKRLARCLYGLASVSYGVKNLLCHAQDLPQKCLMENRNKGRL